jgi:hypothetical protein
VPVFRLICVLSLLLDRFLLRDSGSDESTRRGLSLIVRPCANIQVYERERDGPVRRRFFEADPVSSKADGGGGGGGGGTIGP